MPYLCEHKPSKVTFFGAAEPTAVCVPKHLATEEALLKRNVNMQTACVKAFAIATAHFHTAISSSSHEMELKTAALTLD